MSTLVLVILLYLIWSIPPFVYLAFRFRDIKKPGGYMTYRELTEYIVGAFIPFVNIIISVIIISQFWQEIAYILDKKLVFCRKTGEWRTPWFKDSE